MGLSSATKCSKMTQFCSGIPVDTIPHFDTSPEEHALLIAKKQSWMKMLNWLQQCTCPDLATIFSLLATCLHCPSPGHLDVVKYVGRYILSTMDLGLLFTTTSKTSLEGVIHFPLPTDTYDNTIGCPLTTFCDASWGPQDTSHPSHSNIQPVTIEESKSICGHLFFYSGCPILWKTHKEKYISQSSCKAEIEATNECVIKVQMFCHIISDLSLTNFLSLPSSSKITRVRSIGPICSALKGWDMLTFMKIRFRRRTFTGKSLDHIAGTCNPADIFTKEFKSDCTFHALRDLLVLSSSFFPT
jgi:hypothetical protein